MPFINWIIEALNDAAHFFYQLYLTTRTWIFPLNALAGPCLELCYLFNDLAWYFYDFGVWVYYVAAWVQDTMSYENLWTILLGWLIDLQNIIDWFKSLGTQFVAFASNPIEWTLAIVQPWIDFAVAPFQAVKDAWDNFWYYTWPEWTGKLSELKSLWDNFWVVIFPSLVDLTWLESWWNSRLLDVQDLINTALLNLEGSLAGWQEIRDSVLEFFADPLEWLWARFTNWFLGPEG